MAMKSGSATPLDVIEAFYISDTPLKKINKNASRASFEKAVQKAVAQTKRKSADQFLRLKMYAPRMDNYLNSKWKLKKISLADCGPWPRMGNLSAEYTTGSIVDVARHLKSAKGKAKKRKQYIEKLSEKAEILNTYVPLIVFEGGIIRNTRFVKDFRKYKKCRYDIDDGNNRAVAMALAGHTHAWALVGKRYYTSPLLFTK